MQSDSSLPQEPQEEPQDASVPEVQPQVEQQIQPQEPQPPPPVMDIAPPRKSNLFTIVLSVLMVIAIGLTGWQGYRVSQSSKQLDAANASLTGLQADYETLTAEKTALDAELASVKSDLESTQNELKATQDELTATQSAIASTKNDTTKVKAQIATLKKDMQKARTYNEILRGGFEDGETFLQSYFRILAIGDDALSKVFVTFLNHRTVENFNNFVGYILTTIVDILEK